MAHRLWINGQWTESREGGTMKIENPATGAIIAEGVDASHADVDVAVQAARTALYDGRWSKKPPAGRCVCRASSSSARSGSTTTCR